MEAPRPVARVDELLLLEQPPAAWGFHDLRGLWCGGGRRVPVLVGLQPPGRTAELLVRIELALKGRLPRETLCAVGGWRVRAPWNGHLLARAEHPGVDLASAVASLREARGALPMALATEVGRRVLSVALAHPSPVVLGPRQVRVGWDGTLAVELPTMDATYLMDSDDGLWIAPEVIQGRPTATPSVSVYLAACVAYWTLARAHPIVSETATATYQQLVAVLTQPVIPLHEARPEVPDALARVVDLGLSRDPSARPTPEAFVAGLAAVPSEPLGAWLAAWLEAQFGALREAELAWWEQAEALSLDDAPAAEATPEAPAQDFTASVARLRESLMRRT